VLLKGYGKYGKDRGRLSSRSVREMEGGGGKEQGAILTAHGCLCAASQYCSTVECARWHVPCAMCLVMCLTGQYTNTQN